MKTPGIGLLAAVAVCVGCAAQDSTSGGTPAAGGSDLYLKVRLDSPVKASNLRPGDQVSGKLLQDVYSGMAEVFPASSVVHLEVERLDRRRRVSNDHWPWVVRAFTPRHEKYPLFRSASVTTPDGHDTRLEVSVVSTSREVEILPKGIKGSHSDAASDGQPKLRREIGPIVTLEGTAKNGVTGIACGVTGGVPMTIEAGTMASVILLQDVSASKDRAGDSFQARLVQPVRLGSTIILPEGSVLEGKVLKSQPPRTLSRSASISLAFTNLSLPGGFRGPIAASVAGAEISRRSHTVIDAEGRMHGERPGAAWMALNSGVTAGISKEVDDGTQLIIEALVSSATDASTAGTAKIVSTCVSAIFLLTRHGRDVVLPKYTQLRIMFDRSVRIPGPMVSTAFVH